MMDAELPFAEEPEPLPEPPESYGPVCTVTLLDLAASLQRIEAKLDALLAPPARERPV